MAADRVSAGRTKARRGTNRSPASSPVAAGPDPAQVGVEIFELLSELVGRMQAHLVRTTSAFDLPPAQARALLRLSDPLPMRTLAEVLHCDASNVTGIVDGLESRGLVERRPDPTDRRVKHLVLTDKGRRVRTSLHARLHKGIPGIEELTAKQQRDFREILRRTLDKH
jgi:DNA-binding MarR family transcriptional regulator